MGGYPCPLFSGAKYNSRAFQFTRNAGNTGMRRMAVLCPEAWWFFASPLFTFLLKEK
jgi:hypothetical protein